MSQSLSWIDPSVFSAALNRAGFDPSNSIRGRRNPIWLPGTNLGSAPRQTTPVTPPVAPAAHGQPASAEHHQTTPVEPVKAELNPPVPAPSAKKELSPLKLESDRLDQRLEAYMAWVEDCTACKGLFIVDEEGLVLMERDSDPNLVALSAYFLNLKDRIPDSLGTRSEGSIAIDLDDERVLHVVQADTRLGPHALGFTVESPLHRDLTQSFQDTLSSVFAAVG